MPKPTVHIPQVTRVTVCARCGGRTRVETVPPGARAACLRGCDGPLAPDAMTAARWPMPAPGKANA